MANFLYSDCNRKTLKMNRINVVMNDSYEKQIASFIAAGNVVIGKPEKVLGDFNLNFQSGKNSSITFSEGCILNNVSINMENGSGEWKVGKKTYIRGRYFIGAGSKIEIGDQTAMNRHVLIVATEGASITIGKDCLFSDITMSTTDWHSIIDDMTGERINPAKCIVIEDSVWLGENVTIQKGITIGKNSIIGSKALVTKTIPPGSLAVGIPAKIIRENVRWQRVLIPMDFLPAEPY